jgi:transcriptional regulator with XRE-family HTH domain
MKKNLTKKVLDILGITKTELARRLGVSKNIVYTWSNGYGVPNLYNRYRLERLIGIKHKVNSYGEWVTQQRRDRGWILKNLADATGLSIYTVYQVEKGSKGLRMRTYEKITRVLGPYPSMKRYILKREKEKRVPPVD